MRAISIDKIGIGKITELAIPQPEPGQLLVRVGAVGVCLSDVELWEGSRPAAYIQYPVTPGHEWSGTVTEIGSGVAGFAVHDRVAVEGHNFCSTCFYCKCGETNLCSHYSELGFTLPGAYAEYVTVRADLAHKFSAALPFEVAALTEPASCVANGIVRANLDKHDTLVVVDRAQLACWQWPGRATWELPKFWLSGSTMPTKSLPIRWAQLTTLPAPPQPRHSWRP